MPIRAVLIGAREAMVNLMGLAPEIQTRMRGFIADQTLALRDGVKSNILSMFRTGEGPMYNAVQAQMQEETAGRISGVVWIDGIAIPYARIQEEGGVIQHPGSDKFQAFFVGNGGGFSGGIQQGTMVFTRKTKPHPIPIPEHPYMRFALARQLGPFNNGMRAIVDDVILGSSLGTR